MALIAVGALTALAVGSAAALQVNGGTIQAGIDTTLTCDDVVDVKGWGFEQGTGLVHNVRIGGIAPACVGNSLFVTVTSGGSIFQGSILELTANQVEGGTPGTATVAFTPRPPEDITAIHIVIEGENES
jgi:hypothetical protein